MQQPAEILERIRNGLQEVGFAFVEATEAVSAERLHDADVDVSVVVAKKSFAVHGKAGFESAKVV